MPKRIQRKRTKGWKMPEGAVYVGRPTKWGNPYKISDCDEPGTDKRENAVLAFALSMMPHYATIRHELRGKDLCCWCKLSEPCHADELLDIANS